MSIFNETPEQEAARINAASGDPTGITAEQVANNRRLNSFLSGSIGRKPDGTPISNTPTPPDLPQGNTARVTGSKEASATIDPNNPEKLREDPNKTSSIKSFSTVKPKPGGPPYENVLEQFASYTPLWTLACLTPDQFNDPRTYRGNPSALKNIIFASAGRFDEQRTTVAMGDKVGAPEYFVDNVVLNTRLASGPAQGNTNVIAFSFDVYEPYSLGLFIQSLQAAAIKSGYPSYFNDTPYLLKLEFVGHKDNGAIFTGTETLAKYFVIKITKVEFTVNEGGSQYKVQAVPLHHTAFSDLNNNLPTDVIITGENAKEILVSGQRSLCTVLNKIQQEQVPKQQNYADLFEIVFPVDSSDPVGLGERENVELLRATADPNAPVRQPLVGRAGQDSQDFGFGEIGASTMGFGPESGGNYLFPLESDTVDPQTGRILRDQMIIDPKQRSFMFKQGDKITEVIQRIVIASKYGIEAVKPENLDGQGRAKWFRIDAQIKLLEFDKKRNTFAKKYIFRVVPYKVDGSILSNPSSVPAGVNELKKLVAKRYNYLYTGQNNDLLKFDLTFNGMFYTGQLPRPPEKNANVANTDTNNAAPPNVPSAEVRTGVADEALLSNNGSARVVADPNIDTSSYSGEKTVEQQIADAFQYAFLNSSKDLINVDIEILGDPYYISDSGLNSNYLVPAGPNDQINVDGSMNWEGAEIFCELIFRNPVEPNLGLTGEGGLFNFPNGEAISPFSGTYKIIEVVNKFSSGVFRQDLKLIRSPRVQPQDVPGQASISKQNQALYDTSKPVPPKTSPIDNVESGGSELTNILGA